MHPQTSQNQINLLHIDNSSVSIEFTLWTSKSIVMEMVIITIIIINKNKSQEVIKVKSKWVCKVDQRPRD